MSDLSVVQPHLLTNWLVVTVYDGEPEVIPFEDKAEALDFWERKSPNWSECFLCEVIKGNKTGDS